MRRILGNWRIPAATLFSAALIVGAYLFARSIEMPATAQASEETALLQAIATKDSDTDGLPDWEEQLYGTDPKNPDTRQLGMTDGEAVARGLIVPKAIADIKMATSSPLQTGEYGLPPPPEEGTLTAVFAKNFFALYLDAKQANGGADLSQQQLADVQNKALASLTNAVVVAPNFKSARDLTVSGSGPDALRAFAVLAEGVFLANTTSSTKGPLAYLSDALQKNDTTAFDRIASIAKSYRGTAAGLAALSVPTELAQDALALINSLARLSAILIDFTRANSDPLAAILALGQYPAAIQQVGTAFSHINSIYTNAGVTFTKGMPGAEFVNFMPDLSAEQAASAKKK